VDVVSTGIAADLLLARGAAGIEQPCFRRKIHNPENDHSDDNENAGVQGGLSRKPVIH